MRLRGFCCAAAFTWCCVTQSAWGISFGELLESFDVLETIAGTALVTGGGVNGWEEGMEGDSAVEVELSRPHMAMADWRGYVYVADKDAESIRRIAPDGTIETVAGTNVAGYNDDGPGTEVQLDAPNGLFTFPNGTTYILDLGNHRIRRLSLEGDVATVVEDPFGMTVGRGLWVSPDESLIYYASGTEVRRWTPDEGVSVYHDDFVALGNLTVDPSDGNVVVTDRGGHAVYKIFPDGSRSRIAGTGETRGGSSGLPATLVALEEVRGIQFHPEGGYFLATHEGGQVWFVDDDDIIHLLIDGDDDGTHAGDGLLLSVPGRKISEARAVALAPNGDLLVTEHDGGYIRFVAARDRLEMGDFDQNGTLDVGDIDALTVAVAGRRHPQTLDINFDEAVNRFDVETWVVDLKGTTFGDADLDGGFDSDDLLQVFAAGEYDDLIVGNSVWSSGDWNSDGEFDSDDLLFAFAAGGYDLADAVGAAVPEPSTVGTVWLACCWLGVRRRSVTAS